MTRRAAREAFTKRQDSFKLTQAALLSSYPVSRGGKTLVARHPLINPAATAPHVAVAIAAYVWSMSARLSDPDNTNLGELVDRAFAIVRTGFSA